MGVVVYLPAFLICALVESIVEPYCYCFFFFLYFATATFSFMNSNNIHELVLFFCKRLSLMPETLVLFKNRRPLIPARLKKKREKLFYLEHFLSVVIKLRCIFTQTQFNSE